MTSRKRSSDQGQEGGARDQTKRSKVSSNNDSTFKVDSNGDRYWELSKMRRVTVSEFRGKAMVSVREYYEKDGKELPGKKGISMPLDQFSALVKLLPELETALQDQFSESLPRPAYGAKAESKNDEDQDRSGDASPSKQNIEATSDEDEDEA
ncbi:RNA polymerase II transcriptional coactivator KELP [Penicillium taxi]|uniref:RNA polymerase II transcriptional coactivator KELP n=1 Tax=Penicillium taxi TaxID=168475 RepID=UPI00254541DB|nr:RNA polymerase II transcriptional coactivator KELP [Penicillium taxi]KAJ5888820.1 RNA polymerase II transcriptional coactivator KELP [Penicillium taxi]